MLNPLLIAFSMYTRIPMPQLDWSERNMRTALCFLPLVGAVVGAAVLGAKLLGDAIGLHTALTAALMTAIPLWITGGIHMDGYMDTVDALSSYQDREKKLKILKDPNSGAFAVMRCAITLLLTFGAFCQMTASGAVSMIFVYMLSRTLGACGVVGLAIAGGSSIAAAFHENAQRKTVLVCCGVCALLCLCGLVLVNPATAIVVLLGMGVSFWHTVRTANREFGGVTGDIIGFGIVRGELVAAVGIALMEAILAAWH